jgi:hypothetical protein
VITFITLYPGSTFGYCPQCKCTCEPELFLESDGASRLICVRCLGQKQELEIQEVVDDEDDLDQESAEAYEQWRSGRLSGMAGLRACNAHDCRVHTGGRCFVCLQPSCKEHISANGRCPDCEHVAHLLN